MLWNKNNDNAHTVYEDETAVQYIAITSDEFEMLEVDFAILFIHGCSWLCNVEIISVYPVFDRRFDARSTLNFQMAKAKHILT